MTHVATADDAAQATKLRIPRLSAAVFRRDRVASLIEKTSAHPVTVVRARAGAGKTVACATWAMAERRRRRVAWLTLDEGDRSPARVLGERDRGARRRHHPGRAATGPPRPRRGRRSAGQRDERGARSRRPNRSRPRQHAGTGRQRRAARPQLPGPPRTANAARHPVRTVRAESSARQDAAGRRPRRDYRSGPGLHAGRGGRLPARTRPRRRRVTAGRAPALHRRLDGGAADGGAGRPPGTRRGLGRNRQRPCRRRLPA